MNAIDGVPDELWLKIFAHVEAGQTRPEQQATRRTLERVCRSWQRCAERWRLLAITGLDQVDTLLNVLELPNLPDDLAPTVKTLYVRVPEVTKVLGHRHNHDKLGRLLGHFSNLTTIEIVIERVRRCMPGRGDGLGEEACKALAANRRVARFKIGSVENHEAVITDQVLARYACRSRLAD